MAKYGRTGKNFRVNTYAYPSAKGEGVIDFPTLSGGLNIYDLDYRLKNDESPEMKNLHWKDGALGCRPGQNWLIENMLGEGFCAYEHLFWDYAFVHIKNKIICFDPKNPVPNVLYERLNESRGTFFRYGDYLFYKNRGAYVQISYSNGGFTAKDVEAYVPITYTSMHPTTHAGISYQPENRLSPSKTLWYDAEKDVTVYHLPEQNIEGVSAVVVDGVTKTEQTDYDVDYTAGTVTFKTAPPVSNPFTANTVRITYSKSNPDMYNSVMDCCYAAVFGGNQNVCVVLGGCPAQPNAYFWNGNHIAMDAGYFPAEQYNFAGDTEEEITAFGKQQNMLVIFKRRSVGRTTMSTTTTDSDRLLIEMPYTAINSRVGCDLPWTVQLIENNLVFCNTEQGVHMVLDSSAAYENNIVGISRKVNGDSRRPGLLNDVRNGDAVCAFDDDARYWLVANGNAYVWDYELSAYKDPSWFFYTNIHAVSFFRSSDTVYHLNAHGQITLLDNSFGDYGEGIDKVYQFATQMMGSYERLKDVRDAIFVVRSDTNAEIKIRYDSDYESRYDLTPISSFTWAFVPRNLAMRYLGFQKYAHTEKREPKCRNIRHFSMRLENDVVGQDLSIISAQIFYNFQGRYR